MVCVGDRVHVSEKGNGTVKWIGTLDGVTSLRAGIELDTPFNTCHDGSFKGVEIFVCRQNSGIFLKLEKIKQGVSLVQAIHERYLEKKENETSKKDQAGETVSPGTPILVGEEKACKYYSDNLYELTEISVDDALVDSPGSETEIGKFAKLKRLSLRNNCFSEIGSILHICNQIPSLREIDISGSRFSQLTDVSLYKATEIESLIAVGCANSAFPNDLLPLFPNLIELRVDGTGELLKSLASLPSTLTTLSIKHVSGIKSWTDLGSLIRRLVPTGLNHLDMSKNDWIKDIEESESLDWMAGLETLDISCCQIENWETIRFLSSACTELKSLRVTGNRFYDSETSKGRQIIVAAFPRLLMLNNATISPLTRDQCELYCANFLARQDDLVSASIRSERKNELVEKFRSKNDILHSSPLDMSGRSFTSRMFTLTIAGIGKPIVTKVPKSSRVSDLVRIVASKISWPFKQSQLRLHASSSSEALSSFPLDDLDLELIDTGIDDGWTIFTSVADGSE